MSQVTCPHCRTPAKVTGNLQPGASVQCPSCNRAFVLAASSMNRPQPAKPQPLGAPAYNPVRQGPSYQPNFSYPQSGKPRRSNVGLIVGLVVGGMALALLAVAGCAVAWFLMNQPSSDFADPAVAVAEIDSRPSSEVLFTESIEFDEQSTYQPRTSGLRYLWSTGSPFGVNFKSEATIGQETSVLEGRVVYTPTNRDPSSVVGADDNDRGEATGTGFFVRPDGYLITCAHVVQGAIKTDVMINGEAHPAKVVAMDTKNDLAIIRIRGDDFPYLELSDSDRVRLAEDVRAFGFPLADQLGTGIKITGGSVSGINEQGDSKVLQLDVTVNPGNSGGPLMNDRGQVIGVVTALMAGEDLAEMSFAVTSNEVRRLLERNQLTYAPAPAGAAVLSGPDLAERVQKSVAFLKVTMGPGGIGIAEKRVVEFQANWRSYKMVSSSRRATTGPESESGVILLDAAGEVTYCDGEKNLPAYLGTLALVGLPPLADDDSQKWASSRITMIPERSSIQIQTEPNRGLFPPGYRGLGRLYGRPQTQTLSTVKYHPAVELASYEVVSDSEDVVEVKKTMALRTIHADGENPYVTVNGTGNFEFGKEQGFPESMMFSGQFNVTVKNKIHSIPFKVSFTSRDEEELAADAAAKAVATAEARKRYQARQAEKEANAIPTVEALDQLDLSLPD